MKNETQFSIAVITTAFASAIIGISVAMVIVIGVIGGFAYFATSVAEWISSPAPVNAPAPATLTVAPSKSWGEEIWYAIPHDVRSWLIRPVAHGVSIRATATECEFSIVVGADSATISNSTSACKEIIAAAKKPAEKVATAVQPTFRRWTLTDPRDGTVIEFVGQVGSPQITAGKHGGKMTVSLYTIPEAVVEDGEWGTIVDLCECSQSGVWEILVGSREISSSYFLDEVFPLPGPLQFIVRVPVTGTFGMEIYAIPEKNLLVLEYEGHQAHITVQHFFIKSVEKVEYAAAFENAVRVIYQDPAGNQGETWIPLDRTQWPWWVFKNSETTEENGK